jgi:cyclophilin family peptidyl-prolyl cis-trans isomerase/HEAT repeat protein
MACLFAACTKPAPTGVNKFSDTVLVSIADFQDRRLSDSLYPFFKSEHVAYRKDAVSAFASLQDSTAIAALQDILEHDADSTVRSAAAYALGQTPSSGSSIVLQQALNHEKSASVLREILEGYGRTTKKWSLDVAAVQSPEGLAWSMYRAGLRGKIDSTYNSTAAGFLTSSYSESARLGAANYFARGAKNFVSQEKEIIQSALSDASVDVRMAATSALRKIKTEASFQALAKIVKSKDDYRIVSNAVRSLQSFPWSKTSALLIQSLSHENVNVAISASEVINSAATPESVKTLEDLAFATKNFRIQADLFTAALSVSGDKVLADKIAGQISQAKNPYQKAALIASLESFADKAPFVKDELIKADTPVVRSTAASTLVGMNRAATFKPASKKLFATIYQDIIKTGDAAVIGTVAGALADSTLGYKAIINDFSFLIEAKNKLSLPRDNEALQPLEEAIAYFEGKKTSPVKNEFNHPIPWKLVKSIAKDQRVLITTTKGDITIRLRVEDAPGSVANFVWLMQQKYFDGKFFHRVVPNFVIQAGCNRGDGWGSEDYSIRSEFAQLHYTTGSMGMASAGKDTEGTQWFITHSPTPHLDGRYTIFAETESGLDVVNKMEVGDQIAEVKFIR